MAQEIKVVLIDDVDGGGADETVTFALDGVAYEIDLASRRAQEFRAALAPWVERARRVNGKSARTSRTSRSRSDVSRIRAWAKSQGYSVRERGRIAYDIREAYEAAHS